MLLSAVYAVACTLLDALLARIPTGRAHAVELLALRHEVRVLRRRAKRTHWRPADRLLLAALSRCAPRTDWWRFPVRPETLVRWHRDLVRRKCAAFGRHRRLGRPPIAPERRALILRLARENPTWGYQRIRGELLKLGHAVAGTTVQTVLRRHRGPPAPRRAGLAWPAFLRAHAAGRLACAFFCVETGRLQTLYALFFLEVQTRRVAVAGCTAPPTAAWVTQQARNVCWDLVAAGRRPTVLLRDRDATFAPASDAVFAAEGVRVVRTPVRAPRANAVAERWVGTVRRECLDRLLIFDARHRQQVLRGDADHDNRARPHRARGPRSIERGTLLLLQVSRLPRQTRAPQDVWLWWQGPPGTAPDLAVTWRAYVHRFDLEHTFKFLRQALDWAALRVRHPAADRWTRLLVLAYTQLQLARPLVADRRLPWERPQPAGRLTPYRVRRQFRQRGPALGTPAAAPKPAGRPLGRPKGRRYRPAPRYPAVKLREADGFRRLLAAA